MHFHDLICMKSVFIEFTYDENCRVQKNTFCIKLFNIFEMDWNFIWTVKLEISAPKCYIYSICSRSITFEFAATVY